MKTKTLALLTACLAFQAYSPFSEAMTETLLNSRMNDAIPKMIQATNGNFAAIQQKFSITQIPELDQLWDARKDIVLGSCKAPQNNCRYLSVFRGQASDHPIVLMPGFTGYRKMYIEQIYDLLQAGYGPVYISDFAGSGDSYKPELNPGQPEPKAGSVLKQSDDGAKVYHTEVANIAGVKNVQLITNVINALPLGVGYIPNFDDYQKDVDFVMLQAVHDNPDHKIIVSSLSMTGLVLAIAIANQNDHPTWITHVDRFVFESPMIRTLATNKLGKGLGAPLEFFAHLMTIPNGKKILEPQKALPEFADKALGHYNPNNAISHSPYRLGVTDSMRVWNGHETAGATFGYSFQELSHQYSIGPLDSELLFVHPLNHRTQEIASSLKRNHIPLIVLGSLQDQLVDTGATKQFLGDLVADGAVDVHMCTFATSRHVMDQESDHYREPYMALILDQKSHVLRDDYGVAPRNEVLHCAAVGAR